MSSARYVQFDKSLCVICQSRSNHKVTSTTNGCQTIREAAIQRQDIVHQRLNGLEPGELFKYHVSNFCYRTYVNKAKIARAVKKLGEVRESDQIIADTAHVVKDKSIVTRSTLNNTSNIVAKAEIRNKCGICGFYRHNNDRDTYRICEMERATKFFKAIWLFKDDTYTRYSHLENVTDVFAADIYCHKNCIKLYLKRYDEKIKSSQNETVSVTRTNSEAFNNIYETDNKTTGNDSAAINDKFDAISYVVNSLLPQIRAGEVFTLTTVRIQANEFTNSRFKIANVDVKNYLEEKYSETIEFSIPSDKKKPTLFYDCSICLADLICNQTSEFILKKSAKIIKNALQLVTFDLDDKFLDVNALRSAWEKCEIPEELLIFFTELYTLKKRYRKVVDRTELPEHKLLKLKSLYQIMAYILKSGNEKTPLHVLIAKTIHSICKSKALIESLNHLGLCISYDQVLKSKTNLAEYTIKKCLDIVPLPSHFIETQFTKGAFDNFDHNEATLSGLNSTHDTVCVLFQDFSETSTQKPSISSTLIDKSKKSLDTILPCQVQKNFFKPSGKIKLTSEYLENSVALSSSEFELANIHDLAWLLCRMDISNTSRSDDQKHQNTPNWAAFNSIFVKDDRNIQSVGFMPIFPHPVTEFATVYTVMCNFKDILSQLDQKYFPLFCDEGVYRLAKPIQRLRGEEFKNIVLMLGSFHAMKILQACIGGYLEGSGVEHIFIETECFGENVVKQILSGTHYNRSMSAYFLLGEALQRLQIEAFLNENADKNYDNELSTVSALQDTLSEGNFDEIKALYNNFCHHDNNILSDYENWVEIRCEESPEFKYWTIAIKLIQLLRNMDRADRQGIWSLHVDSIKKSLPVFRMFNRINYLRDASEYYQDMIALPMQKPELYNEFIAENFTVKRSPVSFTSVGTDQALEQTINRSQKSSSGIIGATQKKEYVTAWNLTYHELLAVKNLFNEITHVASENDELPKHHDFNVSTTSKTEKQLDKIIAYITSHSNPFKSGSEPLKNIITQQLTTPECTESLLNIFDSGCKFYQEFFLERFVQKSKNLADTISKVKLVTFKSSQQENTPSEKSLSVTKQNQNAQRIIEIAKERKYNLEILLSFELTQVNPLFNEDGSMKKEKSKSDLVTELEALSRDHEEQCDNLINATLIVDVMLKCRQISWKNIKTFGEFVTAFCTSIKAVSKDQVNRIDFIFDSYFENSIKLDERSLRYKESAIEIYNISENVPMPKQENQFWASQQNKILLQTFIRKVVLDKSSDLWPNTVVICSAANEVLCQSNLKNNPETFALLQRFDIEEADSRIIVHIHQLCIERATEIFVLSADTDVFVLLLYYWSIFKSMNLQKLWIQVGAGATKRVLAIHKLAEDCGIKLCSVLPAVHHLTGADYTSKVGTKYSAVRAEPIKYLEKFAHGVTEEDIAISIRTAEQFLLKVLKKTDKFSSFDMLRHKMQNKFILVSELPPTSASIRLHILRAFYATYQQINLLNPRTEILDPVLFGYCFENERLVPRKSNILLPPVDKLLPSCNCKVCSTKACCCHAAQLPCISFCKCRVDGTCKNPYNNE